MAIVIPKRQTQNITGQVNTVGVEKTGEDFGAGLANQAANIVQDIGLKQQASFNLAAVQEAETGLSEWENESLYGENGFYKLKGKNAAEQSDQYLSNFDKFIAEKQSLLTNDIQKKHFNRMLVIDEKIYSVQLCAMSYKKLKHTSKNNTLLQLLFHNLPPQIIMVMKIV
tara:strand:- start:3487 stop:3993 length:507 start_codon:yes stop_codon:yes gene_type:complete